MKVIVKSLTAMKNKILTPVKIHKYKDYTIRVTKSGLYKIHTVSGYLLFTRTTLKDVKASIDLI